MNHRYQNNHFPNCGHENTLIYFKAMAMMTAKELRDDANSIMPSDYGINTLQLTSFGQGKVWKNNQLLDLSIQHKELLFFIVHNEHIASDDILRLISSAVCSIRTQEINDVWDDEIIVQQGKNFALKNPHHVNYDVSNYNSLANIGRKEEDDDIAILYLRKALSINNSEYLSNFQSNWVKTVRRNLMLEQVNLAYQLVHRFKQLNATDMAVYYSKMAEQRLNSLGVRLYDSRSSSLSIDEIDIYNANKYQKRLSFTTHPNHYG